MEFGNGKPLNKPAAAILCPLQAIQAIGYRDHKSLILIRVCGAQSHFQHKHLAQVRNVPPLRQKRLFALHLDS
jgi:hypothetical protein